MGEGVGGLVDELVNDWGDEGRDGMREITTCVIFKFSVGSQFSVLSKHRNLSQSVFSNKREHQS